MTADMYGSPRKCGLETVGEIDWSSGSYEFDLTVVWRRTFDGAFVYGEDSGCSCPEPFDNVGLDELTRIASLEAFKAHLLGRQEGERGSWDTSFTREDEIARLLERLHGMGLR